MKTLFVELIKNTKFDYDDNNIKNNIENYSFNGLPVPYDLECKNVLPFSLTLSWKIDTNINFTDQAHCPKQSQ